MRGKSMDTDKLYILSIRMGGQIKRLFFKGTDSNESEQKFEELQKDIPDLGEPSPDWEEFVKDVIWHFEKNGFTRIKG